VNYGVVEDYEQLAQYGISVKGAIVLARYGRSWRGIKPKLAAAAFQKRTFTVLIQPNNLRVNDYSKLVGVVSF
jgi:hypothetical protein